MYKVTRLQYKGRHVTLPKHIQLVIAYWVQLSICLRHNCGQRMFLLWFSFVKFRKKKPITSCKKIFNNIDGKAFHYYLGIDWFLIKWVPTISHFLYNYWSDNYIIYTNHKQQQEVVQYINYHEWFLYNKWNFVELESLKHHLKSNCLEYWW